MVVFRDNSVKISKGKYQSILSDMGIQGVESVVDGAIYVDAFTVRIKAANYEPDNLSGSEYRLIAQTCGEKKKTSMYSCYVLGEDEAVAAAMREAYIKYLQSNRYKFIDEWSIDGSWLYAKDSHAVKAIKTGKVS